MEDKRRAPRLEEETKCTITIISERENPPKEIITYKYIKDISVSGAKLQTNNLLPIEALVMIEMQIKILRQTITVLGKVKWVKMVIENESYEAGVKFLNPPSDEIKKLADYISWKQKFKSLNPV